MDKAALPGKVLELRERVVDYWSRFPTVQQFLEDHFPDEWSLIRPCRMRPQYYRDLALVEDYKVAMRRCRRLPQCVYDTMTENHRRALDSFNAFSLCTPKGEKPRFYHVVMTAPLTEEGEGWGGPASEHVGAFALIAQRVLVDIWGPGIGGQMSYQDFGERGFKKRHPHWDMTLNGYRITPEGWERLPAPDLRGLRKERLVDEAMVRHAQILQIGAQRGNFYVSPLFEGVREYGGRMKYQVREMVDFRKVEYLRREQKVRWLNYDGVRHENFSVDEWLAKYQEYEVRVMKGRNPRKRLHRRFGHMADSQIGRTQARVDGQPLLHDSGCVCATCRDWTKIFLDDEAALAGSWDVKGFHPFLDGATRRATWST